MTNLKVNQKKRLISNFGVIINVSSLANVEKVVKPPKKPVTKNAGNHEIEIDRPIVNPIKTTQLDLLSMLL